MRETETCFSSHSSNNIIKFHKFQNLLSSLSFSFAKYNLNLVRSGNKGEICESICGSLTSDHQMFRTVLLPIIVTDSVIRIKMQFDR